MYGFLVLIRISSMSASEIIAIGKDSCRPSGLFCFRSTDGTNTQIHLERYCNATIQSLFHKAMDGPVMVPICLTNGVLAISSDGIIRKFNLKGDFLFAEKPNGFDGASAMSGRITDDYIFMTATVYEKTHWLYYLYIVDISGVKPIVKVKIKIIQPVVINVTYDEIVVVGREDTMRFPVPKSINVK
jgi:hypothetical protein